MTPRNKDLDPDQPRPVVASAWVVFGLGLCFAYFALAPSTALQKPVPYVVFYILAALVLDLFVGASRRVVLQRITPAVVLGILITPGIPASVAIVADLVGTVAVASTSRLTWKLIGQAGRALLPVGVCALYLLSQNALEQRHYLFCSEIFLILSLLTRTSDPPYRSDLFLVVSYPAIAFMLRFLSDLSLIYVLLAVPLLFLLTTVDTEMILRYFHLQKKLDDSQTAYRETRKAQRASEIESRRKGILLNRREQELSLLNGLGRQLDAAKAADDLARYLLKECHRLIGVDTSLILFCDRPDGRILRIISPVSNDYWGLREGEPVPATMKVGITARPPWEGPVWKGKRSFLMARLGEQGWLILSHDETDAFPEFLNDFFTAVGRHAGSSVLAIRRLSEVREIARREALEKDKVAAEKEKVAEQNHNLRLLIEHFEELTKEALNSDRELFKRAEKAIAKVVAADLVIFDSRPLSEYPQDKSGLLINGTRWASHLFIPGQGPSGNLLCLGLAPESFQAGQQEWCNLFKNFLDKTLENGVLHKELRSSYAQLERTQEEIVRSSQWAAAGRLAANAAHELNTPLGAIRLAAEQVKFFLKPDTVPEPAITGVQSILRSVDRCRQVTDRLLITSRPVDQGETEVTPELQPLNPIIRDAIASMRPYLRASNIKLADHRLTEMKEGQVVLQDFYWAVVNLLKNAVDVLSEQSGDDKRINVAMSEKGDFLEVSVADNGTGVPEELAPKLFEPFFTTKKLGQGNGLGLSLSRTNLRKWGGDLEYSPTPGGGATFTISVPKG